LTRLWRMGSPTGTTTCSAMVALLSENSNSEGCDVTQLVDLQSVIANDADRLLQKHGPMPARVEDISYHVRRAYSSLDDVLRGRPANPDVALASLLHLSAVLLRCCIAVTKSGYPGEE
jgi:hypothetical protein